MLQTTPESVINWEQGRSEPAIKFMPRIIDYLSYCPLQEQDKSMGQKVRLKHRFEGLTSRQLAKRIRLDQSTVLKWEEKMKEPNTDKVRKCFQKYLGY